MIHGDHGGGDSGGVATTMLMMVVVAVVVVAVVVVAVVVVVMVMAMSIMHFRYYISVRAHGEFSSPFASTVRFLISPEVSVTPPFIVIRTLTRMRTFLDSWSYSRSYNEIQHRSYFLMVVVENWNFIKSTGASVLIRFARDAFPNADTPYTNDAYVVEQEPGCFVLKDMYLSAFTMYVYGVIVQAGPPPLPLASDGSSLPLAYTMSLYTADDYSVTCRQV